MKLCASLNRFLQKLNGGRMQQNIPNYVQRAMRALVDSGENTIRFFTADPVRRIPPLFGAAAGAIYGDSIPEKAFWAAGLAVLGYYARDIVRYVWNNRDPIVRYIRRHPYESAFTLGGLFLGTYVGNWFEEATRDAFIPIRTILGTVSGGVVGNLVGRGIDQGRRRGGNT